MPEPRRFLAVHLPWLAAERLARREPELRSARLLLVETVRTRQVVRAVNPAAAAAGLEPGMSLADARAILPDCVVRHADPVADGRALDGLADWCGRYTPLVGIGDAGTLVLDVTGCAHLFGGERALLDDLRRRLARFGYSVRMALADTPGAAWGLAHHALHGADGTILPAGDGERLHAALAPLPVTALRLDTGTAEGLHRLGLTRVGHLLDLPRAGLVRRFGPEILRRLDQAAGRAAEPITPRRPAVRFDARVAFAEPIGRPEDIEAATAGLLQRLCRLLEEAGQGARQLELAAFRVDGRVQQLGIGTARPNRAPDALRRLFREKLERLAPGEGIEVLALSATTTEPLAPDQIGLAAEAKGEALAGLVDRLANRLARPVMRPTPVASWIPERAVRPLPPFAAVPKMETWPADRPRPLRLLAPPEPVEAMAPVPDDPPVQFRWRGTLHRIRAADGPERLAPEWWIERPVAEGELRDYYRVEDQDGRRWWLFRRGLYVPGAQPRWFLHGVFG